MESQIQIYPQITLEMYELIIGWKHDWKDIYQPSSSVIWLRNIIYDYIENSFQIHLRQCLDVI